jgi:hypothetical protein
LDRENGMFLCLKYELLGRMKFLKLLKLERPEVSTGIDML